MLLLNKFLKGLLILLICKMTGQKHMRSGSMKKGQIQSNFILKNIPLRKCLKESFRCGCGAGGKSLYYASLGAKGKRYEVVAHYEQEALGLAKKGFGR